MSEPTVVEPGDGEAVEAPDDVEVVPAASSAEPRTGPQPTTAPVAPPTPTPAARRVAPAAAAVALLWLVGVLLRRRKR